MLKKYFKTYCSISIFLLIISVCGCKTNRMEVASDRKLLEADTTEIDSWEYIPGKNEKQDAYKVFKRNNKWFITVLGNEPAEPDTAFLRRSLKHLGQFQAVSELHINEKNWDTLAVTDTDTRLVTSKNGKVVQEIFLGKMFFKESKTTYFVRLKGEDDIYTVQQYLDGSLKMPAEKARKKAMVSFAPQEIKEILFLKPEGIDFNLLRAGQKSWSINGILTNDSTSENFVRSLCRLQVTKFSESPTSGADLSIQISTYNGKQISLRAYRKNNDTWILSSSDNIGNYLEMPQEILLKMFPGREYFMQAVN